IGKFHVVRPRDITVNAAIGPRGQTGTYITFDDPLLNGFLTYDIIEHHVASSRKILSRQVVQFYPLNDILSIYMPADTKIDVLNLDIELMEETALSDLNFNQWRPSLIVAEIHTPINVISVMDAPVSRLLYDRGYVLASRVWHTSFFISTQRNG